MGQLFSSNNRVQRVIYVSDLSHSNKIFELAWPSSFDQFKREIQLLFPKQTLPDEFVFETYSNDIEHNNQQGNKKLKVIVKTEQTYAGLVAKHKLIAPDVHLFYVCLELGEMRKSRQEK